MTLHWLSTLKALYALPKRRASITGQIASKHLYILYCVIRGLEGKAESYPVQLKLNGVMAAACDPRPLTTQTCAKAAVLCGNAVPMHNVPDTAPPVCTGPNGIQASSPVRLHQGLGDLPELATQVVPDAGCGHTHSRLWAAIVPKASSILDLR